MVRCRGGGYNRSGSSHHDAASGRHAINRGGASHRPGTVSSDDGDVVRTYSSGRYIVHRGGRSHRPNVVSNDDVRTHTSGRHVIHRGGSSSGSPRTTVAVAGHTYTSGRHVVDHSVRADAMDDMDRELHHNELHHELDAIDDNDDDDDANNADPGDDVLRDTSQRPLIEKFGKKYVLILSFNSGCLFMLLIYIFGYFNIVGLQMVMFIGVLGEYLRSFLMNLGPHSNRSQERS